MQLTCVPHMNLTELSPAPYFVRASWAAAITSGCDYGVCEEGEGITGSSLLRWEGFGKQATPPRTVWLLLVSRASACETRRSQLA